MSFGDGGAGKEAKRARQEEEARQLRIKEGTTTIRRNFGNTFNDSYYAGLMDAVKKAYMPDVQQQFKAASRNLRAALLRAGLGSSSTAIRREGTELPKAQLRAENEVTQRGIGFQNQRKQDVAYAENTALNQLNQTADSQAAFANAAAAIKANYDAPAMPMLGQVFTDLSAGLATQADLERYGQAKYNVWGRIPGWTARNTYSRNVPGG